MVRVTRLSITDTLPDGSYRTMSFQYGPDRERWYSELTDDGVTFRSRCRHVYLPIIPLDVATFHADCPFVFVITENTTGTIYFIGTKKR